VSPVHQDTDVIRPDAVRSRAVFLAIATNTQTPVTSLQVPPSLLAHSVSSEGRSHKIVFLPGDGTNIHYSFTFVVIDSSPHLAYCTIFIVMSSEVVDLHICICMCTSHCLHLCTRRLRAAAALP